MSYPVLLIGKSGSGKSTAMRNLDPETTAIINCGGKPLPFRGPLKKRVINAANYAEAYASLQRAGSNPNIKTIVIDDFQYLTGNEFIDRIHETGFGKFDDFANHTVQLIRLANTFADSKVIYYFAHEENDANGNVTPLTFSKFVREKFAIEGIFSICLRTKVIDAALGDFRFTTVNGGNDPVKAPMGMFGTPDIPNDLTIVNDAIWSFYEDEEPSKEVLIDEPSIHTSTDEPVNTPPLSNFPSAKEVANVVAEVRKEVQEDMPTVDPNTGEVEERVILEHNPTPPKNVVEDWVRDAREVITKEKLGIRITAKDTEESVWQRIEAKRCEKVSDDTNNLSDMDALESRILALFGNEEGAVKFLKEKNMLPPDATSLSEIAGNFRVQIEKYWDRFVVSTQQ